MRIVRMMVRMLAIASPLLMGFLTTPGCQYQIANPDPIEPTCRDFKAGIVPTSLSLNIVEVQRNSGMTRVKIDGGSNDGLRVGDRLSIGRDGGFVGKLRLTEVAPNSAWGEVSLESEMPGPSRIGDTAYFYADQKSDIS